MMCDESVQDGVCVYIVCMFVKISNKGFNSFLLKTNIEAMYDI